MSSGIKWYQITLNNLCAGICTMGGIVTKTAPCFRWMQGKDFEWTVKNWVQRKGGTIEEVRDARRGGV